MTSAFQKVHYYANRLFKMLQSGSILSLLRNIFIFGVLTSDEPPDPNTEDEPQLEFTKTEKGKDKLYYNDYFYVFDQNTKSGKAYWRCESYKICSAWLHITDGKVSKEVNNHSHGTVPY